MLPSPMNRIVLPNFMSRAAKAAPSVLPGVGWVNSIDEKHENETTDGPSDTSPQDLA
jgi:hypothetical protein